MPISLQLHRSVVLVMFDLLQPQSCTSQHWSHLTTLVPHLVKVSIFGNLQENWENCISSLLFCIRNVCDWYMLIEMSSLFILMSWVKTLDALMRAGDPDLMLNILHLRALNIQTTWCCQIWLWCCDWVGTQEKRHTVIFFGQMQGGKEQNR